MTKLTIKNSDKLANIFGHVLAHAEREDKAEFGPLQIQSAHTIRSLMYLLSEDNAEFDAEKFTASMHAVKAEVAAK